MRRILFISVVFASILFGQQVIINSVGDFNRIQIVYNLPDYFNPKIVLFTNSQKNIIQKEYNTTEIIRPKRELKETDHYKEWKKSGREPRVEIKNIVDYKKYKNFYIVQAIDNDCCHISTDILIWEIKNSKLLLKALYPYQLGGCLYCKTKLSEIENDTIIFMISGMDAEDIYGSYEYYILYDDSVKLVKKTKYKGFNSDGHYSVSYKNYYYNKNEDVISSNIDFIYKINGNDRYAFAKNDTLRLHLITADYLPYTPKYLKTINLINDSIRVGQFISDKVTVLWKNEWYITYQKYLEFKK